MAQLIKSPNLYLKVFGTGNCSIRARDLLFNRGFFFSFFNSFFLICFLLSFFSLVMKNINT